jgi:putative nucleotidyltransferase with HDIG domain
MSRQLRVGSYVVFVSLLGVVSALLAGRGEDLPVSFWPLLAFVFVSLVLDLAGNPLRVAASGSMSFIVHMAGVLLYGGFWGAMIAGISTLIAQVSLRNAPIKIAFNVAQRVLCIGAAALVYKALGGGLPPSYLVGSANEAARILQRDVGLFYVFAAVYFAVNTVAVSGAIAISSGQPFRELWNLNSRGVLGYDLVASTVAMLVAWLFRIAERGSALGPFGLVGVFVLILSIRHIYGMYRKLQNSGKELLDLMVKAIEARDPYTSGHSIRVATLAKAIAQESGMPSSEVDLVHTAAVLHDVGKIHEEFAPLLRKESKLTREETALLQTHSIKSAELVGIISSFRGTIQDAVRSHHERWDGGGYPDGLAGEAIPMGARMIMISDTIDAMSTDRPYRKRLPLETVLAELQKYRGSQFDPHLVDLTINSVNVRRVIANLQTSANEQPQPAPVADTGGSKRMLRKDISLWRARRAL